MNVRRVDVIVENHKDLDGRGGEAGVAFGQHEVSSESTRSQKLSAASAPKQGSTRLSKTKASHERTCAYP
jgi:hypothetical protein